MGVILKAEQIEKTYGKGKLAVNALKPGDLTIEEGRFYSIIGRSGSGKSTLLHILGGLDRPTGGKLYIEEESVFDLNDTKLAIFRRRRIGFVFQAYNLLPEHTVLQNILLPIELDGRKPDKEHIERVIKALGIEDKLKYYPDELSGGQRQRVACARALAAKPAIILADEPTGNLDGKSGDELIALLKESAKEFNQTIIIVTHDMKIAENADTIILLEDGIIKSFEGNIIQ
ncbi:ABC transporter ATP-binding protein [Alloiococcus sp. CFN-8]|uniref:ABC transporter ATP-binding protein n=1 Tax=Alloiococcus sp. CFN-8 TaxID=3416081 RepID=UPI003CEAED94